eukprot:TRINITY_DN1161_c0_g2_i1.p1 TRINITY_DN1161_c0_g2~~TRINITY_DN1161_c0_g2_i1.p1  ORF type:complete len:331 (+),score=46.51 TRINITY_DN1161_c0_g2_i1:240-1232(+)
MCSLVQPSDAFSENTPTRAAKRRERYRLNGVRLRNAQNEHGISSPLGLTSTPGGDSYLQLLDEQVQDVSKRLRRIELLLLAAPLGDFKALDAFVHEALKAEAAGDEKDLSETASPVSSSMLDMSTSRSPCSSKRCLHYGLAAEDDDDQANDSALEANAFSIELEYGALDTFSNTCAETDAEISIVTGDIDDGISLDAFSNCADGLPEPSGVSVFSSCADGLPEPSDAAVIRGELDAACQSWGDGVESKTMQEDSIDFCNRVFQILDGTSIQAEVERKCAVLLLVIAQFLSPSRKRRLLQNRDLQDMLVSHLYILNGNEKGAKRFAMSLVR